MLLKENIQRAGVGFLLDRVLKYVDKDPKKNILKLIGLAEKFAGKTFPEKTFKGFRDAISDDDNVFVFRSRCGSPWNKSRKSKPRKV